MTDEEVKEMVAGLAVAQAGTDRLFKELAQKADQRHEETEVQLEVPEGFQPRSFSESTA